MRSPRDIDPAEPGVPRHDPRLGQWLLGVMAVVALLLLAALLILMISEWVHV
jgi:hypothetical protein